MNLELNTINILNIFLFSGVIHGIIVAIWLFLKNPKLRSHVALGFWILLLAMSNFQIIINSSSLYQLFGQSFTLFLPLTFNLFFGPLIWIFIKKSTDKNYKLSRMQWLHLIPGLLEVSYFVIVYSRPLSFRQDFYMTHWSTIEPTLEVLAFISFVTYLILSLKALKDYEVQINNKYSDASIEKYEWLKRLLLFLLIFTIIWGILTISDVFFLGYSMEYIYFYPYYFFIAFISYFIGFSYKPNEKKKVLLDLKSDRSKELISKDKHGELVKELASLMEAEKPYLNSELRSKDIAESLKITVQSLSYVLNKGMNRSFHDYVNHLRVEHVKHRLNAGDLQKKNLAGIAQESGFNSESSFYRIFKKFTGSTPKSYLK